MKLPALAFLYNTSPHHFSPEPVQKLPFRLVIVHDYLDIVRRSEEKGVAYARDGQTTDINSVETVAELLLLLLLLEEVICGANPSLFFDEEDGSEAEERKR